MAIVLVALGCAILAPAQAMRVGPPEPPNVSGFASCSVRTMASCQMDPAGDTLAGVTYLLLVVTHGPSGRVAFVGDSQGDTFTNVSYCWLDDGVFGHTSVDAALVSVKNPSTYRVSVSTINYQLWAESVLVPVPLD